MLVKPINNLLTANRDPEDLWFLGTVEDNLDPEKLGRVKVLISVFEGCTTEQLPWACPILGSCGNSPQAGGLNVPEVGSQVRVFFPSKDLTAPFYMGAELNASNKTTFFDDDYPNVYGYKDSIGDFIKIDKAKKTIQMQHASTSNFRVSPDGSMQFALSNGAYFTLSNMNYFEINAQNTSISGAPNGSMTLKAGSDVKVETNLFRVDADVTQFSGDVSVGTGATGQFWTLGHVVSVKGGIIVSIE